LAVYGYIFHNGNAELYETAKSRLMISPSLAIGTAQPFINSVWAYWGLP